MLSGCETRFVQINKSLNASKGTLRGLHYQLPPAAEVKVVRAIKGVLWDVIVDLRAGSPTYRKGFGAELNENNRLMMYVPRGFGHGFVTLSDHVEALYLDSAFYSPEAMSSRISSSVSVVKGLHGPRINQNPIVGSRNTNPILRFGNDCVQILWL